MIYWSTGFPGYKLDISFGATQDKVISIEFVAGAISQYFLDELILILIAMMQGMHEICAHTEGSVLSSCIQSPVVVAPSEVEPTVVEVEDVSVELLIVQVVFHHDEDVAIQGLLWVCGVYHLMLLDSQLVREDD